MKNLKKFSLKINEMILGGAVAIGSCFFMALRVNFPVINKVMNNYNTLVLQETDVLIQDG